ncbi:MAG: transcription-repair coupling factor, partial [Elusimicrobia bacterium]|nr:transcription-repair coupling factor [Elusimicrobiota bacterium]
ERKNSSKPSEISMARFGEDARTWPPALEAMRKGARCILLLPGALEASFPKPEGVSSSRLVMRPGLSIPRSTLLESLIRFGYTRVPFVEDAGEYSIRGSVVDIYLLGSPGSVRIFFKEDVVESIRELDPGTQRTSRFYDELVLVPVRWEISAENFGSLLSWATAQDSWIVEKELEASSLPGQVFRVSQGLPGPQEESEDFKAKANLKFQGNLDLLSTEIRQWHEKGWEVFIFCLNRGEQERLFELLEPKLPSGICQFVVGPLLGGFGSPSEKLGLITSSEIFERSYRSSALKLFRGAPKSKRYRWTDLKPGDFVVHEEVGIGRYGGLQNLSLQDCLLLSYRGGDKLYVPLHEFKKIQRYVGAEGKAPRLSSLDRRSWEAVKQKVRESVQELAEEILKLEAARAAIPAHAFSVDTHLEKEFEDSFPYEETPDQQRTIEEVKRDMQSNRPMNRVVVGDVGFGKTEVAIRAALKCALGYKQTAFLVPTTILADQHYRTFQSRLADYPIKLGMLSRFAGPKEQKVILSNLQEGSCDIVIGTHRLLQSDIQFKDLGLLIIDEEHRFGVKDKEKLKALKKNVHTLLLSATPIPRTLYQTLSGLRNISLIQSPPAGRLPIHTEVVPWDEKKLVQAIREELDRGGQVYYVHNRVAALPSRLKHLEKILPGVRFCLAHGQLSSLELEKAMWDFANRKFDVLVASTIIESGLDIPSVNTLIVENAHEFGLAQLYQLRGRVGREKTRAYCYLFYPRELASSEPGPPLSEDAGKRLSSLKEFSELGSGFRLAMRDLEIRGAGDLLGARQHGFLNAVGLEMYCDLLNQAVARLKGGFVSSEKTPVRLDLGIPAYIPEESLPDEMERLNFYKRLLDATPEQCLSLREEFLDISGEVPRPVENLFSLVALRSQAEKFQVRSVVQKESSVEIFFRPAVSFGPETLSLWSKKYGKELNFLTSSQGDGVRIQTQEEVSVDWLTNFLSTLKAKC